MLPHEHGELRAATESSWVLPLVPVQCCHLAQSSGLVAYKEQTGMLLSAGKKALGVLFSQGRMPVPGDSEYTKLSKPLWAVLPPL